MSRALAVLAACLVCPLGALAQEDPPDDHAEGVHIPDVAWPDIAERGSADEFFLPKGWKQVERHFGDLDRDGRQDLVLLFRMASAAHVVKRPGSEETFDSNPRMLVVALKEKDGTYRRVVADPAFIPRPEDPYLDDPLGEGDLSLSNKGVLKVRLHWFRSMGGWTAFNNTFAFRYQDGCLRLIGFDRSEVARNTGGTEDVSVNYLTGKGWARKGNIEDKAPGKQKAFQLKKNPVVCLESVGNGLEFQPAR
jgi:hypothetical protein